MSRDGKTKGEAPSSDGTRAQECEQGWSPASRRDRNARAHGFGHAPLPCTVPASPTHPERCVFHKAKSARTGKLRFASHPRPQAPHKQLLRAPCHAATSRQRCGRLLNCRRAGGTPALQRADSPCRLLHECISTSTGGSDLAGACPSSPPPHGKRSCGKAPPPRHGP